MKELGLKIFPRYYLIYAKKVPENTKKESEITILNFFLKDFQISWLDSLDPKAYFDTHRQTLANTNRSVWGSKDGLDLTNAVNSAPIPMAGI